MPSFAWTRFLLSLTALSCLYQIIWFWRLTVHNINYDAISYIGIARHLASGDFHGSLHGYWSPLISWIIAAGSLFSHNLLLVGHAVTAMSFLLCLALLYRFTLRLWQSSSLAALSVLLFTLCRGTVAFSVSFVGADFLLTAAVLIYFTQILQCLENQSSRYWLMLGIAHAAAFLAKAFAMPWPTVPTLMAAGFVCRRSIRLGLECAIAGLVIPLLVWTLWGVALQTKYGHFTAGYQSKWNLLDADAKESSTRGNLAFLRDTSHSIGPYMVADNMYPASPLWEAHLSLRRVIPQILGKEKHNLPEAVKQIVILITPGGVLALILSLRSLGVCTNLAKEATLAWIVMVSAMTLVIGYCMLVFDARYIIPLVPLLIAFAVRLLVPAFPIRSNSLAVLLPAVLFVSSTILFFFYWASPFRSIRRDYQTSVYSMAEALRRIPSCNRLVVIGKGPFPEHGVGWEAGIYASYFAECRVVAFSEELPSPSVIHAAIGDLRRIQPDSALILGKSNQGLELLMKEMTREGFHSNSELTADPEVGGVGQLFWR
jgi:hypothetical protein